MSSQGVGRIVEEAMRAKGWSQRRLGAELGVLSDGRIFDSTQIRLIVQGRRRYFDTELVQRLIEVLDFTEEEADELWFAAGVWPADLDVAGYRRFRHLASVQPGAISRGKLPTLPVDHDLGDWVRRLRVAA